MRWRYEHNSIVIGCPAYYQFSYNQGFIISVWFIDCWIYIWNTSFIASMDNFVIVKGLSLKWTKIYNFDGNVHWTMNTFEMQQSIIIRYRYKWPRGNLKINNLKFWKINNKAIVSHNKIGQSFWLRRASGSTNWGMRMFLFKDSLPLCWRYCELKTNLSGGRK